MDNHAPSGAPGQEPVPGSDAVPERPLLALRYAALSDVGRVRKDNQDAGFAGAHLLMVADGVGGAARGDVASSTAVATLAKLDAPPSGDPLEALAGAIHRAHDRIAELVEERPELDGTSTTLTSVLFDGQRIGVAHVGDSRGYLLRDNSLAQLTRDHTFVQGLVDEGRITEEESRTHPHRNLILRAVDGVHETDPDLFYIELAAGDRLLLCSDGASGVLDRDRLADILGTGTVDYAAVELVRASLEAGSSDNVTCVVADVVVAAELDDPDQETAMAGTEGPLLVGAAANLPRPVPQGPRTSFRGHRGGDTGEIDPVTEERDRGAASAPDPEELRYAPRAPQRFRWLRRTAVILVVAVAVGAAALLAYRWTQTQFFVAESAGRVAVFRGVQADIPGLRMNHVEESSDVPVAALPRDASDRVGAGIPANTLTEARAVVDRLAGMARTCPVAVGGGRAPTSGADARADLAPPNCVEAVS